MRCGDRQKLNDGDIRGLPTSAQQALNNCAAHVATTNKCDWLFLHVVRLATYVVRVIGQLLRSPITRTHHDVYG